MSRSAQDRILDAAIRSFAEVGFGATSTAGVAREAGVTQPLVHHHFGSKDGLWKAAADRVFSAVAGLIRDEPEDALLAAAERFIHMSAARPELSAILARESASPGPRLTYLLDNYLREPMQRAVKSIVAAQAAGQMDKELRPDLFLFFMVGASAHLFNVPALAKEALGVDVQSERTREDFLAVMRAVLRGVSRAP